MQKNNNIIVIKIGSAVLSKSGGGLDKNLIRKISAQVAVLAKTGYKIIIVSSGAIAAGIESGKLKQRPKKLSSLQAAAAIGQSLLMKLYNEYMSKFGLCAAQLLLTRDDFGNRKRYINVCNTISELLHEHNAIPIINENDTVAVDEIKFGDNDTLSALVANLVNARKLIMLTNVDGLYSPEDKQVLSLVTQVTLKIQNMAQAKAGKLGTGGMQSKLRAVKIATDSGISCVIANGKVNNIILKIINKEAIGTTFLPAKVRVGAKKRWIALCPIPHGVIFVDEGAKKALIVNGRSLLATGIKEIEGSFKSGDIVMIKDLNNAEFARGAVNFSSRDLSKIIGLKSSEIKTALNTENTCNEIVHRDNMVIL